MSSFMARCSSQLRLPLDDLWLALYLDPHLRSQDQASSKRPDLITRSLMPVPGVRAWPTFHLAMKVRPIDKKASKADRPLEASVFWNVGSLVTSPGTCIQLHRSLSGPNQRSEDETGGTGSMTGFQIESHQESPPTVQCQSCRQLWETNSGLRVPEGLVPASQLPSQGFTSAHVSLSVAVVCLVAHSHWHGEGRQDPPDAAHVPCFRARADRRARARRQSLPQPHSCC